MLFGRDVESARIDEVLAVAEDRRSGSLVLRGAAGIGKSALLEYAVEQAGGFRVLRASGVESEAELAFAGVQQLVRPVMHALAELPAPQAHALKTAFAIEEGPAPDRLTVSIATLSLLAAAADEKPLLCVVDDAHWLDQASSEALTFAARRLHADAVVMLFAAREPDAAVFLAPGLPELCLRGLASADARALLGASATDIADRTADRLIELAHGNPLALLEIPRALSEEHRTGLVPLDQPLPVGMAIERSFLTRANALSSEARRALLLVAAGDPGDAEVLWRALAAEHLDREAILEAEAAGLLLQGRLDFCHPLARSAIYQTAPPPDRRAIHATLAEATTEPDRRAWHLAAATDGPDEAIAAALEDAAAGARRRGGAAAEAKALDRAAQLTADAEERARRRLNAALAAEAAGWFEQAETMLSAATELTQDPDLRAQAVARRSYLLADRGEFDRAYALAVAEAEHASPQQAAFVLTGGATMALLHSLDIRASLATAERAWQLAGATAEADLDLCEMRSRIRIFAGRTEGAHALARSCLERADAGTVLAVDFGTDLLYLEDYPGAAEVLTRVVERAREAQAPGILSYALGQLAKLKTRTGSLTSAYALALESVQLTEPLRNDVALADSLAWLAHVEAMLGRDDSRAHAETALTLAEGRHDKYNVVRARGALGLEALARGEPAAAVEWLEPAARMLEEGGLGNPNVFRLDADLAEALTRLGRAERAEPHLVRLEEQVESTGSPWGRAAAARCRAFLSPHAEFEELFEKALDLHEYEPSPFERARTELCYGERLRRMGERRAAREQLRSALATFDQLGAQPWADRARVELRASGERIRRRDPTAAEELTPQELQIARLVAQGLRNRDVGARLFLSPKTVEFHLTRIYRKLEIHSRSELMRRIEDVEPVASGGTTRTAS